ASERASQFVFGMIDRRRCRHEQRLIPTDDHGYGHLLATIFILAKVLAPSLRHGEQDADGVFLGDHAAVGPRVEDTRIGILGNDTRGSHDETATVLWVPLGNRKLK